MIGGGFCIENSSCSYDDGSGVPFAVRRIWVMNAMGDEAAIYVDPVVGAQIGLRAHVWWSGVKT